MSEKEIEKEKEKENQIENELSKSYKFSFKIGQSTEESYESSISTIRSFNTISDFWTIYQHLQRPSEVAMKTEYHLFQENVKPMWEDENNTNGGQWILTIQKGYANLFWEELILAFIGGYLDPDDEICGIVLSIRLQCDKIGIWNRHGHENEKKEKIKEQIKKILNLSNRIEIPYRKHYPSPPPQKKYQRAGFRNSKKTENS